MEIVGEIIRKTGEADTLAIEAAKTSKAFDIGKDCGLFYVPKVINFDAKAGVLEFERLDGLVTLLDMAARKDHRLFELLKKAGVDMTGAEPFNKTMAAMNRTMDEIEAILDKKGK